MRIMFNNKKEYLKYFLPSCITLIIYCIILTVKGIYPFGSNTIDYYDMAQQIAAFYYHVYDMLHGTKAFFYDWYSALGTNMAMSTSGCSNLSPFNLFFLFIERSSLLKSLSVFNGLKLMVMSFTMYFYLDKTYKKSPLFFKLAGSTGYSFCGFVLVLYITNQWVDVAALFPLIMYFYDRLIEDGRMKGYVITLTLTLIVSYYLGFMILIFIFLYTGIKVSAGLLGDACSGGSDADTGNGKNFHLVQLGTGTVMSMALSSFILVPQLTQMLNSARFKNGNESEAAGLTGRYVEILSHVRGDYTTRWWSLLGISFAAAVIATGIIRFRKERRTVLMSVSLILIMVLELFFESINLIWHFGSYIQYPIRNGFIIYYVFAYLMCFYAERMYGTEEETKDTTGKGTGCMSFVVTVIGFLVFVAFYRNHPGLPLRRVFHMTSVMMAAGFIFYFMLLNIEEIRQFFTDFDIKQWSVKTRRDKNIDHTDGMTEEVQRDRKGWTTGAGRYRWTAGVLVLELLCYGFLLFGKPDFITGYSEEPEQNGQYIYLCEQLREKLDLGNEYLYRIKNPDESLNANYGFVLMQPALSNWTHMIAPGEQEAAAAWGYSIQFTRLLDSGGTVFSDALIGVRKVISRVPMDERLYTEVNRAEISVDPATKETVTYYLYEPVYTLPFGVVLTDISEKDTENDIVGLHNSIYNSMVDALRGREDGTDAFYGRLEREAKEEAAYGGGGAGNDTSDGIATWYVRDDRPADSSVKVNTAVSASDKEVTSVITVNGDAALYMLGSGGDREYANCTIETGTGEDMHTVPIPTIGDPENIYYPAHFNNNAVYLGTYTNETVEVTITMNGDKGEYFDVDIMGVSLESMKSLCAVCREKYPDRISGREPEGDHAGIRSYGNGLFLGIDTGLTGTGESGSSEESGGTEEAGESFVLLPVTYDKGFTVTVNGRRVKSASYAGLFTLIPLEDGFNEVSMSFVPPGMRAGIAVTVITLALTAAYIIIMRINRESLEALVQRPENIIEPVLVKLYAGVFAAVVLFMYVIPVIYGIYALATGR